MNSVINPDHLSKSKFVWRAIYADGTIVNQVEEVFGKTVWKTTDQIDRSGLRAYDLIDESGEIVAHFTFLPGDLVAFRKRAKVIAGVGIKFRMHIVSIRREEISTAFFIDEDTREVTLKRQNINDTDENQETGIYYPIVENEADKIPID